MCSANRRVRFSSNSDRESEFPQAVESCRPKRRSHNYGATPTIRLCLSFRPGQPAQKQSGGHLVEQRLRLLQVDRIKPFSKPTIYRSKKSASFLPHPLVVPKSRHAHRCTQLPGFCLLRMRNRERALEIWSRLRRTQLRQLERDFAGYTMDFCLVPTFLCCFHRGHRFANAAPSLVKLAEFRIGPGQM